MYFYIIEKYYVFLIYFMHFNIITRLFLMYFYVFDVYNVSYFLENLMYISNIAKLMHVNTLRLFLSMSFNF